MRRPDPRLVAGVGPAGQGECTKPPVCETHIAAGAERIIAVYNQGPRNGACGPAEIGFAMAELAQIGNWEWTHEGTVEVLNDPGVRAIDPAIAYNPITGDFVLVGLVELDTGIPPAVAHALPLDTQTGAPFVDGWEQLDTESELPGGDKCWIVAGEMNEEVQEFYVAYNAGSSQDELYYIRSTDGGYTWIGGPVTVSSTQVEGKIGSY